MYFIRHFFVITVALCLLAGCAEPSSSEQTFFDEWKARAELSTPYSPSTKEEQSVIEEFNEPVPLTISSEQQEDSKFIEPEVRADLPLVKLSEEKISLRIHQTDVATLLRSLARAVDQNIIINDKVTGTISVNISDAPWDKVFHGILKTQGLYFEMEGEIIRVQTLEDRLRDYEQLETQKKIEQTKRDVERIKPKFTKIIQVNYADAFKLVEKLKGFISIDELGKSIGTVDMDEHTNSIIIQSTFDDIDKLTSIIEKLDKPTQQILIKAHIVEASKETARELGIKWGGLYHRVQGGKNYWITPGAKSGGIVTGPDAELLAPSSGSVVDFPTASATAALPGFSLGFMAQILGKSILDAQLSALQKKGQLNILSSPSITTLDNQHAVIESGKEVPFQTVKEGEVNIQWKKAVLSLKVVPHIIDDSSLRLNIITHKDELDFTSTVQGNPTILTKNAETNVILFDGQTTVIGGLTKEISGGSQSGVPWLQQIPLLGWLFKGQEKSQSMEEVLIFITPYILDQGPPVTSSSLPERTLSSSSDVFL